MEHRQSKTHLIVLEYRNKSATPPFMFKYIALNPMEEGEEEAAAAVVAVSLNHHPADS